MARPKSTKSQNPAVAIARQRSVQPGEPITLSTGVRAVIVGVSPTLVEEAQARIPDPPIPMWHDPEKDRDVENPTDPLYKRALAKTNRARGLAAYDVLIMMGLELVEEVPQDGKWLQKLKMLDKLGHFDLSEFDMTDPFEREFVYKRHLAAAQADIDLVLAVSGMDLGDVEIAEDSFRD
jgi:hypothetical protein